MDSQNVVKSFRKDFPEKNRPSFELTLPRSLSTLTSEKLSDVMTKYTAWREFTDDLLIEAFVDYRKTKETYEYEWHKKFLTSSQATKYLKEMKLETDPILKELKAEFIEAEMYYNLLQSKQNSIKDTLAIISREISRRGTKEF